MPLSEVAAVFNVGDDTIGANLDFEVYPGRPGVVIAKGRLRQMCWGFPLQRTGKQGQTLKPKPVNNARAEKLGNPFWRQSFKMRRCIIPMTAWAEAEGAAGAKTRTWLSLRGAAVFACAGIWRQSDQWGDVYSMVMTNSADLAVDYHDRMPVILHRDNWATWLNGEPTVAHQLCIPSKEPLQAERSDVPWTTHGKRMMGGVTPIQGQLFL